MIATTEAMDMLREAGWQQVRSHRHHIWRCPCGRHSTSVGSSRTGPKALADLRSIIRRCRRPA